MFAFALWDRRRRRLLLGRDRLGKKPLYYRHGGGVLFFASEIKALLAAPGAGREVDAEALHHYLAFGVAPGTRSLFAEVASVPAGHLAVAEAGGVTTTSYW